MAARLGIHEQTLVRRAEHGIVRTHVYNGHAFLYEEPGPNPPVKQCSRWNRLSDRVAAAQRTKEAQPAHIAPEEV